MRPTAPETGYGYIEIERRISGVEGVHEVRAFVEKPHPAMAAAFVTGGGTSGTAACSWPPRRPLLDELDHYDPQVVVAVREALAGAKQDLGFYRLGPAFRGAPAMSIDYAVMERTSRAAVVPASLGWSDVGSWAAMWEASPKDLDGNVTQGPVELLNAERCLVRSEGMLTTVIGMADAVVVTSEDAVLVMPRSASQNVKAVVDRLRAAGRCLWDACTGSRTPGRYR